MSTNRAAETRTVSISLDNEMSLVINGSNLAAVVWQLTFVNGFFSNLE